ncbi:alpha/beta fold hydrolase [Stappia indica]|uniref:alpha/beta fold hydrolase n=1 Tax=Stappia indica TaxID=538381 RepID=UPI001CD75300|nr:alpha/beta hydrolase [Stappia indica]MCA1298281.1 alpha/beta hydrolase [Stappia indica]
MKLVDLPDNPIPEGAVCGACETSDGLLLRHARWMPTGSPLKGTVTLLQGRAEFIEKYFETVRDLRARGYAVVTFDWRGQGGSARVLRNPRRGHVDDFSDFLLDLDAVLTKVTLASMPGPHYALAHSTGGAVLLYGARRLRTRFERAVLSAPLIGLGKVGLRQGLVCPLAAFLSAVGFGAAYVPGGGPKLNMRFETNPLTSDRRRFERNEAVLAAAPELEIGAPTIDWLAAACRAMKRFFEPGFAPDMALPVLIVTAGQDRIVSTPAAERFARQARSVQYLEIPGARHELLMEADLYRDQFLAAFSAFVDDKV